MKAPLRLLLIEDSEDDALLLVRELRKGGYEISDWERVCTRPQLEESLKSNVWDLIICDHYMPGFGSLLALEIIHERELDIPVLVVSGVAPEEAVTSVMRAGAHDFIAKNNMLRLLPVVARELEESQVHKERRRMARKLADSENRYACLFNDNPAPMLLIDASTLLVIDANPAAAAFFGHSLEILKQVSLSALSANARLDAWKAHEHQRFPDQVRLADGGLRDVDVYAVRIPQGPRALLLATILDQSEHKEIEQSLERLAAAVEQVMDAIVIADLKGSVLYANQAFRKLAGEKSADVIGSLLGSHLPSENIEDVLALSALGAPWEGNFSFRTSEGEHRDVFATFSPVRDRAGGERSVLGILRDVTKELELEHQLRQAEKMDALGTLAAGISHDFNNVLTTILSAAELIKWNIPEDSPIRSKVDAILHAGLCAAGLNRQILAFSRKSVEKYAPMDLTATVREAMLMLKSTLPPSIEIRSDLTSGIWVEGDPTQLQQVVLNLGINAFHAIGVKGGIIEVSLMEVQEGNPDLPLGMQEQRCALLRMRDTGCGMDSATLERIFEPFFTTKAVGEGTGLGLAMVHTAISQVGGQISVSSEVGKGTVFQIYLSCASGQERPQEQSPSMDVGGTENLLFVEDEEIVAALAKQGLQNLGYTVSIFSNPLEALEEFQRHPDKFDLLLTDLAMPEMNGADLTGRLQELRPGLPAVLVTGMPPATALTLNARADFRGVLPKPFTSYDLAKAVRKALSSVRRPESAQVQESSEPKPEPRKGNVHILVAEDSHTTRGMIRSWLEHDGYKVNVALDGMEAWKRFNDETEHYDLLLTDVVMPRMDGLELAQLVRRADPSIPIAVLTSNEDRETMKSALNLGVNEYLNKPFEKAELLRCVEKLLAERATRLDARRSVETAQAVRLAQKAMVATPERDLPLYSLYEPLTDAGGDIFRCMQCQDKSILFVLADVAGHSVSSSYAVASFLTMLSSFVSGCHALQTFVHGEVDPLSLNVCPLYGRIPCQPLRHLALKFNQSIQGGPFSDVPVCALFGHWTPATGRLHLLNAGIPHAVVFHQEKGEALPIEINGTPLGILPEPMMEEQVLHLHPGDRVLMGTDGFFDVLSPEHKAFYDKAPSLWQSLGRVSVDQAMSHICEEARRHGNGVIADDLMMVAFEQPALKPQPGTISLHLPSTPDAVDVACDRLGDFLHTAGVTSWVSSARVFDITLAVREALINAVSHGNQDRADAFVDLHGLIDGLGRLEIKVSDEGNGFEINKPKSTTEMLSERGRGLSIIQHSADSVLVNGGELTMTFHVKEDTHDKR